MVKLLSRAKVLGGLPPPQGEAKIAGKTLGPFSTPKTLRA
jgi:hypothetical protein